MSGTSLVAIVGALETDKSVVQSVDLVNPRKAPIKRDYRRARILGAALAMVALFAAAGLTVNARFADWKHWLGLLRQKPAISEMR